MGVSIAILISVCLGNSQIDYYSLSAKDFFELPVTHHLVPTSDIDKELLCAAIFHASNAYRFSKSKPVFLVDSALLKAANYHAQYLATASQLEHENRKERAMIHPQNRIAKFGGTKFEVRAENLAKFSLLDFDRDKSYYMINNVPSYQDATPIPTMSYSKLARLIVEAWTHSKGHKQNLLGEYQYLGCGISPVLLAKDNIPEIIIVQNFASY